ncbi:MAG: 50S ribosomal protein L29 [Candidatus Omnitrophica bacterium]|nr:50S ribosomal protein L29 [Candidatus Omnitrophota bacterium]
MNTKDLRALDIEELIQKEKVIKKELFGLNYQRKFGKVEKPARFSLLRKDVARIKTVLKERKTQ